ncbi:MAG: hypothetical protein QOJ64_1929 [Acidobacteriota bacterium]|nr:hypothetical protein [Acidobacteriota bacterium]
MNSTTNLTLTSNARHLTTFLNGAWRASPPRLAITSEELSQIAPLLLGSGAGALAWWRIRESALAESPAGKQLQDAYRLHTLRALQAQDRIKSVFSFLRADDIEPILIKGWTNARLYPEIALRPYGDVDLCVRPDQYAEALRLLPKRENVKFFPVDLHTALGRLVDGSWDELHSRSRLIDLDDVKVRVLAPEDHLRILCVNMLKDGAWRPIQLCDIAALLECPDASGFDWDLCLGPDNKRAKWVACAIRLAHELLGARIDHCPPQVKSARVPHWLTSNVLRHWEQPCINDHRVPESILRTLRHPARLPRALVKRWPDPIGATIRVKGSFNELPRLPFQVMDYAMLNGRFLKRLSSLKTLL